MKHKTPLRIPWIAALVLVALPASPADRVFEDGDFAPADWTFHVFPTGFGGVATSSRESASGLPGAHLRTRITVNAPSSTGNSVVNTVTLNQSARHNPATEGEIFAVNYSEHAQVFLVQFPDVLGPNGWQRVAVALMQDGNYFTAPAPFLIVESTNWETMEQYSLRAADFIQVPVGSAKPDFSTNGTEIVFGFFRANSTPAGSYPNSTPGTPAFTEVGGLDNWRVELLLTSSSTNSSKLPRAGRRVATYAFNQEHPTLDPVPQVASDEQFEPAPIADFTQYLVSSTNVTGVGAAPGLQVARAEARIGVFAGVRTIAQGGATIQTLQPSNRLARATSRDIRHFVAVAEPGTGNAVIDLWMIADGFFELIPLNVNNPWEPYYEQLTASAEQSVILHRESVSRSIMSGTAKVHRAPGNPSIRIITGGSWQGAVTLQYNESNTYRRPTLDYSEVMLNIATVPAGEPFALEFKLRTESKAGNEAADWYALADLYNTAGYTVRSSTPGVQIIEITPVAPPRPVLGIRRLLTGYQVYTLDDPGADEILIEYSTDFADWADFGVLAPDGSEWRIDDPEAEPSGSRFYRAIRRQLTPP